MAKVADRYLEVDPWAVVERGFDPKRGRISESIFSLANEFLGVRGYFEEAYSGDRLIGCYVNGLYEEMPIQHPQVFKGFVTRRAFGVNTVDWLHTRLVVDGETLDLAVSDVTDFERRLDLKAGTLSRTFVWRTRSGKRLRVTFLRFVSMVDANLACQRMTLEPLGFSGSVDVTFALDFSPPHEIASGWSQLQESGSAEAAHGKNFWTCPRKGIEGGVAALLGQSESVGQWLFAAMRVEADAPLDGQPVEDEKLIGKSFTLDLADGRATTVNRLAVIVWERDVSKSADEVWAGGLDLAKRLTGDDRTFDAALAEHTAFWAEAWDRLDIELDGAPAVQQGLRFSLFNLYQTYQGRDERLNVPCKGMTAEVYYGWIFWDTETYCVPFYLFTFPEAARALLRYRYLNLEPALARARQLGCRGARFPFATIDGTECCGTWQHCDLEDHVNVAVAYGVWLYVRHTGDRELEEREGIEMLLQISRYFADRGGWSPRTGEFGLYGVMGPDEYHTMVNNNCYTNFMVKKTLEYTLEVAERMQGESPQAWRRVSERVGLDPAEPAEWRRMAEAMRIPGDLETGVFEQHDGYFDLPHVDVPSIPPAEVPIYQHWPYIKIFRHDMIKQPDVLLFLMFYAQEFTPEVLRANYEFYESRCIHESSLSPGVHSVFAVEFGDERAAEFLRYMARLDLDNYNRNSGQGLHVTAMSGAWLAMVYGYAGVRTDGEVLALAPAMAEGWQGYRFRLVWRESMLEVRVGRGEARLRVVSGPPVPLRLYGRDVTADSDGTAVELETRGT